MPLVNIDLLAGRADRDLRLIGDAVHEAMVEQLNVPQRDRFQVVTQHSAATLQFDRHYLDIERSDQFVMVRVTLAAGRTDEAKSAFYARLAELLAERIGLRPEDLAGHPGRERADGLVIRARAGELRGAAARTVALADPRRP
jgi:phenylpyruvate tautomerase PptA (4-oxalocrotonate tautomerase family)